MLVNLARRWFSTAKVPIEAIKRLREETSAPMGECKKALEQSHCDHEKAMEWLKIKGLASAEKRSQKQTREGVVASFLSECRTKALLLEVNCETDFVAKNDLFLKFVEGVGTRLLEREETVAIEGEPEPTKKQFGELFESVAPINIFPQEAAANNLNEELKLVISRLQENIRVRRAVTLHSDHCRYGAYVHRPYAAGIGLQACVVELQVDPEPSEEAVEIVNEFADDMATQILGSPPKYLNFQQIPEQEIQEESGKAVAELAEVLQKAPQHTHERIIGGKLLVNYYSKVLLGCMPYILSNEGAQVSEYWTEAEKAAEANISVLRAITWQCK